jgi:tRNA(fMet)-specific endonuclease VapC
MLDTNICIYIIKHRPSSVLDQLVALPTEDVGVSSITVAELRFGASKSSRPARNHQALDDFLHPFEVALYNEPAARTYGTIRAPLEKKGRLIGPMDLLIAAHALSLEVQLLTNNAKEFKRVDGLDVTNWV